MVGGTLKQETFQCASVKGMIWYAHSFSSLLIHTTKHLLLFASLVIYSISEFQFINWLILDLSAYSIPMADRVNLSSNHSILLSPDSQVPDVGRVLLIAIPITVPWIWWQLGVKCVFVAARSLYRKPTLSTNAVARRQRNSFPVLWTELKRSGSPRSIKKWK